MRQQLSRTFSWAVMTVAFTIEHNDTEIFDNFIGVSEKWCIRMKRGFLSVTIAAIREGNRRVDIQFWLISTHPEWCWMFQCITFFTVQLHAASNSQIKQAKWSIASSRIGCKVTQRPEQHLTFCNSSCCPVDILNFRTLSLYVPSLRSWPRGSMQKLLRTFPWVITTQKPSGPLYNSQEPRKGSNTPLRQVWRLLFAPKTYWYS